MAREFQAQVQEAVRDEAALRAALADADIAPQLMVLVQLTGDLGILEEVAPHIHGAWSFLESVPEALKRKVRDRLVEALQDCAVEDRPPPPLPPAETLQRMMSGGVGQAVPEEYIPLLLEETRLAEEDPRAVRWHRDPGPAAGAFRVLIVGAGLAGLCMGIRLRQMGIPFTILEKNAAVGGTWLENRYPGCAVDTPNHFFSYSFEPNNRWTRHFSGRAEIHRYIEDGFDKYDIRRHVRFGVEVTRTAWDEARARWQVTIRDGEGAEETLSCNALVTAVGQLNRPAIPAIPGLDDFRGPVFHTARWDSSVELKGKRVAMIGTGASAMQAGPSIAPEVAKLIVFQRTPHWAMHNPNYHKEVSAGNLWCLEHVPYFGKWLRFQLFWAGSDGFHASLQKDPDWPHPGISLNEANHKMRELITDYVRKELEGDEALLAKVIPDYPPYGKRMLRDNHWYRMLKRPNVELETGAIERVTPDAITMRDGSVHPVDVIILATGFQASRMLAPVDIVGRGGRSIRQAWGEDDPRAYLGITAPGFPNLFMIYGPNTNLAHGGSIIFHHECQVRYICQALREMIEQGYASLEVRQEVHDAYNHLLDETCARMVWTHPGVTSWYKNARNRVTVTSPWRLLDYWKLTRHFVPEDFRAARPGQAPAVPGQAREAVAEAAQLTVS
ncbi:flavin-containing monooxygenase [Roseicella aquatilis]|uniref:NAD(P)/FAD-dependent oxidoreductase n=1 Tax=Roseicella aquatilis TaxID=2527868 RepID=A0A4R4DRG1_9PROT|nr:NAD(P)/FAD-dependent oxidoreductase [Roseicella aquatilis]TCZ63635.1 NAD(P)/FAD-dependent oxidoreductase [Roseicella aquatilis]